MKSNMQVFAGVCGFNTTATFESEDNQNAAIVFRTECPNLKPMEELLTEADAYSECFGKIGDTEIYQMCRTYCKHVSCPVPSALIKGLEVSCGLALPRDVEIKIAKD